ncbi:hypothetical protein HBI49_100890 [Parastagonospora nodorum]|nr:hypothetical protein HBH50_070860 [Parastagonospora nodorum]KAH4094840.1 hypothetical protein HBH48_059120 [Parastagonospora nodorum]KAH4816946.1 hypothetical protein HBH61_053870 [Parastagonospora nodorum]KAH5366788.1 hypothetical protein HBI49_100890 [Parastagonospora nodorum]KAH5786396.1 hypothetical protein HBI97_078630 [Parastagonospora nodorum]
MAGVPLPLQVGSPKTNRQSSVDNVPAALRAGSPTVGPQARPSLTRKNTSGASGASDRLSQLFPSRPSSIVSISPPVTAAHSRRTSLPSPLTPAAEPTYRIPRAPAPPSFAEDTSYSPTASAFHPQGSAQSLQSGSGKRRLLSRLSSLGRASSKAGRYNKLEDEESRPETRRLGGVEEEDAVGYDLSGFDGLPMKKFEPQSRIANATDGKEGDRDLHEAGYAAEFERLEAQLGAGLDSVIEKPFTHNPTSLEVRSPSHRRVLSGSQVVSAQSMAAQKEAEKTGGIVAVADIPVDISDFHAGSDFDTRSIMTTDTGLARSGPQTSYFFPEDPEQPSWRPFSMGRPWLAMLILIALALAGLQEFLCQWSLMKVREHPEGGLVSFEKPGDLTITEFFTWKYAPIMSFVFYGILWQMTDFDVKRLEPYYQLSKKSGATAGESLNMDYLTFMSWLVPLRALRHKQYAVIYSSMGTLVASSLVPVLQSASIVVYPPKSERSGDNTLKSIRIDPPWSRGVSGSLVFVAFSGAALMYAMRRKSGLQSDPKGIAGIAAMATRSHILQEFRGLDTAPIDKIHKQLRHRRYILHKSALWQGEFIRNNAEKVHEHGADPRPLMLRKRSGVPFITFMVLVTASIPVFMFYDGAGIVTEKLPFLMTALATVIRMLWNTMNSDVRMLQPFWILAQRHAPAKTLTLDYAGTNPLLLPFVAMSNGHYLVMVVAFGSILAEILTVCVSSISVDGKKFIPGNGDRDEDDPSDISRHNTEQTFRSFWSSFFLTMAILLYLITIALVTYVKRSHKFMPRQIGTMASVLAFIHQSRMLLLFINTEKMDSRQMTRHLEKTGKTFALGWVGGRSDGDDHLAIDEEEILAEYRYGVDWTKTRILGHQVGAWEHYESQGG